MQQIFDKEEILEILNDSKTTIEDSRMYYLWCDSNKKEALADIQEKAGYSLYKRDVVKFNSSALLEKIYLGFYIISNFDPTLCFKLEVGEPQNVVSPVTDWMYENLRFAAALNEDAKQMLFAEQKKRVDAQLSSPTMADTKITDTDEIEDKIFKKHKANTSNLYQRLVLEKRYDRLISYSNMGNYDPRLIRKLPIETTHLINAQTKQDDDFCCHCTIM